MVDTGLVFVSLFLVSFSKYILMYHAAIYFLSHAPSSLDAAECIYVLSILMIAYVGCLVFLHSSEGLITSSRTSMRGK